MPPQPALIKICTSKHVHHGNYESLFLLGRQDHNLLKLVCFHPFGCYHTCTHDLTVPGQTFTLLKQTAGTHKSDRKGTQSLVHCWIYRLESWPSQSFRSSACSQSVDDVRFPLLRHWLECIQESNLLHIFLHIKSYSTTAQSNSLYLHIT